MPLGWVKRPYSEHYATVPAKGERGYRPKPRAAGETAGGAAPDGPRAAKRGADEHGSREHKSGALDAGSERADAVVDGERKNARKSADAVVDGERKKARKSQGADGAAKAAGRRGAEYGRDGGSVAAPAEPAKPPSKKQMRKKLLRQKKKAAAGVPELPAQRVAAYSKLKVKDKSKKKGIR